MLQPKKTKFRKVQKGRWKRMQRMGRSTYTSDLGPFDKSAQWVDYYVQADFQPSTRSGKTTAPNEAPHFTYTLTLI